ncbi:MAG: tRNA pseudouridine(13) synthase TruD [Candidatus Micrarchaeota archaeon]|nr:tRNA pseudouridine(13) synthase TruD [Candidatus Micrarchaeota archaeon]
MFRASAPSEFIVEEILPDGTVLKVDTPADGAGLADPSDQSLERDYFCHFVMQKTDWNTMQALSAIAFRMGVNPGRFNFAGTKDKKAVTVQRCSAFAMEPSRILPMNVKDVKILGAWKAREKVKLGDLAGNRFTIALTKENCGVDVDADALRAKVDACDGIIRNDFGAQRFGSLRQNTATVGEHMLAGDFQKAVMEYVAGEGPEPENFAAARKRLLDEGDFTAACQYFPHVLRYEKGMIAHLAQKPHDFVGAMRRLPRNLQLMFVHAFQAKLFNEYIGENEGDFVCPQDEAGFPNPERAVLGNVGQEYRGRRWPCAHIIGYDTELTESEEKFLEEKGVQKESFKIKAMPQLSAKGTFRPTRVPLKGFEVMARKPVVVRFSLPSGSYATAALDQLLH